MSVPGYVQVRRDALDVVPRPVERRTGRVLACATAAVLVLLEADWRSGELNPWRLVAWGKEVAMGWRRLRGGIDRLVGGDLAASTSVAFVGSTIALDRSLWIHDRAKGDERFVQMSGSSLRSLAVEHCLGWRALGVFVALVLMADDRTWSITGVTLGGLSDDLGIGHRSLCAALDRLATAGLVSWQARRGRCLELRVPGGAAVIVAPGAHRSRAIHRHERRQIERSAKDGQGPAAELAERLIARYGLGPASPTLLGALGELVGRVGARAAEDGLVAMGGLGGAREPAAVLVGRVRRLHAQTVAAAAGTARRESAQAQRQASADAADAQDRAAEVCLAEESRWVAGILDDVTLERLVARHRPPRVGNRLLARMDLAAQVIAAARVAVGEGDSELDDPAELRAGVLGAFGREMLTAAGGEPPATLPRSRDGPTLVERLRQLDH